MAAWAVRHDLVYYDGPQCLKILAGKKCRGEHYGRVNVPGHAWRQDGTDDDHATLWYIRNTSPRLYVYSFHEYNVPAPAEPTTTIDNDRGLRCAVYSLSWYLPGTSMHVVTLASLDRMFPYDGELPTDLADFHSKYKQAMGMAYSRKTNAEIWANFLADHASRYS